MKINRSILLYSIFYNVVNGLLFLYATTNSGGEVGGQMLILFPLFWIVGILGLLLIAVKNRTAFQNWKNWILVLLSTPLPIFLLIILVV